jgi:hypothetical protein
MQLVLMGSGSLMVLKIILALPRMKFILASKYQIAVVQLPYGHQNNKQINFV